MSIVMRNEKENKEYLLTKLNLVWLKTEGVEYPVKNVFIKLER